MISCPFSTNFYKRSISLILKKRPTSHWEKETEYLGVFVAHSTTKENSVLKCGSWAHVKSHLETIRHFKRKRIASRCAGKMVFAGLSFVRAKAAAPGPARPPEPGTRKAADPASSVTWPRSERLMGLSHIFVLWHGSPQGTLCLCFSVCFQLFCFQTWSSEAVGAPPAGVFVESPGLWLVTGSSLSLFLLLGLT